MNNTIIIPYSPSYKKTNFKGTAEYNLKVMKYLQKQYKNHCIIIPTVKNKKNIQHEDVSLRWIQTNGKNGKFSIPENYWKLFNKCKNKRFILFPFGFTCLNNQGHANYMIYDKENKTLERFEPYGKTKRDCTNPVDIDNKIKKLFQENLGKDFIKKYYKPLDYLDYSSIQKQQEDEGEKQSSDPSGGFCAAFVSLFAELRIKNPNKNRKLLINTAIQLIKKKYGSLTKYIRAYSQNLVQQTKYL